MASKAHKTELVPQGTCKYALWVVYVDECRCMVQYGYTCETKVIAGVIVKRADGWICYMGMAADIIGSYEERDDAARALVTEYTDGGYRKAGVV